MMSCKHIIAIFVYVTQCIYAELKGGWNCVSICVINWERMLNELILK